MTLIKTNNVKYALHNLRTEFLQMGKTVDRGEWQSLKDRPQSQVFEVHDASFRVVVPESVIGWQNECKPNLPWAEDHFQERVSGKPLNPGEQYKNWPWYEQGVEDHKPGGKFSHTYMERFWPSGSFGNLDHVVELLIDRPFTRQAYLTVWWPHDARIALEGERVPCTLGYHFLAYPGPDDRPLLRATYFMRSCDWFRYLRDDLYMAGRLLQWVAKQTNMDPTMLTMHIANLHIFNQEVPRLRQEHADAEKERLSHAF